MTKSRILSSALVVAAVLLLPSIARAQSAFAGVVKDATGAVLPGVTVEAASPALIEQVRSVTTDANGAYRIENLRPGTYTLTFSLPGFATVKKEAVELQSNFTATINADLKVGAVEETVTVAGESPVVDVQSNAKAQVLSRDVLGAVPSAHTIQSVGQLVVGVTLTAPDVGGSQAMQHTDFTQGGPIQKDKLWFFGSGRLFTVNKPIASTINSDGTSAGALRCYNNPGTCSQGVDAQHQYSALARLTWQVSPRNKLSAYMDRIHKVRGAAMSPGDDQATSSVRWNSPNYTTATVKWTSAVSNKMLIEGGYSTNIERYNNLYAEGVEKPYGSAERLATARHFDSTFGRRWVASDGITGQYPDRYNAQGSATYVTGTHSVKFGFQDSWGTFNHVNRGNAALYQNYVNGAPNTVTVYDTPVWSAEALNANLGLYAQDVWTLKRATFTIGGRYEHVSESVIGQPAQV